MPTKTLLAAAIITVSATSPSAQPRPDLSGTWAVASDVASGVAAAPSPVFGQRFSLQQTGDTLTIVRPQRDTATEATFALDGRETRMRVPGPLCQADVESIEKAAWEGEAIAHTVVGFVPPGGGAVSPRNIKRLFRLQAPDTLVVEATSTQGGQPRQVGTVYKRSTEPLPQVDSGGPSNRAPATIAQVAWISGVWIGTAKETTVEERWTPTSGGSMLGMGRTLRGSVMGSFEFLCIAERGGSLVYSAMPNGRSPATHFTLTAVTADAATFENPAHDYPKIVRYAKRPDGSLETTISGEGGQRPQTFVLKRQEPQP